MPRRGLRNNFLEERLLKHYYIECQYCEEESHVSSVKEEPEFCPMCGTDANAEHLDEFQDSDE